MHRIWISLLTIISWPITQGAVFEFLLDDDEIFSTCPDVPGTNGVSDAVDLSEVTMEYHEGSIWIEGNMTIKWEGVQPTDRIEVRLMLKSPHKTHLLSNYFSFSLSPFVSFYRQLRKLGNSNVAPGNQPF